MKQKLKSTKVRVTEQFRRLAWDELVGRGDFVEDGHKGFKPWEGPTGFGPIRLWIRFTASTDVA